MTPQDLERRARRERLREILEPTPVELGKFPRWFPWKRENKLPGFFDHWGRTRTLGGYVLVTEPYCTAMWDERWEDVQRFAIRYDLKYMVLPNSYHEPGDTLRIVFWNEERCFDPKPWCSLSTVQKHGRVASEGSSSDSP